MSLETDVLQFGFNKNSFTTVICKKPLIIIIQIKLIAIYYCWMPRRPLTELNIINHSICIFICIFKSILLYMTNAFKT